MAVESRYSRLDRVIHRIAFRSYGAQVAIADIEDRLFAKSAVARTPRRAVFVTALPRAGTTLLLECLAELKEFASHRYCDMPFVLIPILWAKFSGRHRRHVEGQERAHADGMRIDLDSPEALEEVLWKTFWKRQYLADRVLPFPAEPNEEFTEFFQHHIAKIVLARGGDEQDRYVSKNNPNIARIALLRRMFPDATQLVPFRDPVQHAASLVRQHNRFVELQTADPFVREYMSGIGHYDFGQDIRPIDFDGWYDRRRFASPTELGFWIEYWIAAYQHLLQRSDEEIALFSYDALCGDATPQMNRLAERLEISDRAPLLARAATIHPSVARTPDTQSLPSGLLECAQEIHAELRRRAL